MTSSMAAMSVSEHRSPHVNKDSAIAVVCPFSSGELLAERIRELGYKLVLVFLCKKAEDGVLSCVVEGDYEVFFTGDYSQTVQLLRELPCKVELIIPGAENGVIVADHLAATMGLVHNPTEYSVARRSKYLMGETIRAAGVRAVKQTIATEWEHIESFILDWNPNPFKVIVKPNASAGSDDVFLCKNIDEVRAAFDCINGAINEFGEVNEGVLVQEFLEGTEFVVDSVSRNGEHKVIAIWQYDKRSLNGQFNNYFGMQLRAVTTELEEALVAYNAEVLDALHINHGPSHAEIFVTRDDIVLVEVGARIHGGHGTWKPLAQAAYGYNQIDETVNAYMRPDLFEALPPYPMELRVHAREVFLVNRFDGILRSLDGMERVRSLNSFLKEDLSVRPGSRMTKTIDLFTMPGRVQLLHHDAEQVKQDYIRIHEMLLDGDVFEIVHDDKSIEANAGPAEE